MAQLAIAAAVSAIGGALVPGVIAFGVTGAQAGWVIGSLIGSAFGPKQNTQGPRVNDRAVTGAEYGQPLMWFRGAPRFAGQIWWAGELNETATTEEAGKGSGPSYTTFTYDVDLLIGLADHECAALMRVWLNGKLVWTALSTADSESLAASDQTSLWRRITFYTGAADQLPDPAYEAAVGADLAPAYRGRAYVFIEGLQLGPSGQIPNLTFEVARTVALAGTSSNSLMGSLATTSASYPDDEAYVHAVHVDDSGDAYFYVASAAAARCIKITAAGVASFVSSITYNRGDIRSKGETDELASLGYISSGSGVYTFALYTGTSGATASKVVTTVSNGFSTAPVWALRNGVLYTCAERGGGSALKTIWRFASGASTPALSYTPAFWCQSLAAGTDYLYALQDSTTFGATDQIYVIDATTMALVDTIASPWATTAQGTGRVLVNASNELFYVRGNGLATNAWHKRVSGAWVLVSSDIGSADPGNNVGGFTSQTCIRNNTLYVARLNTSTHAAVVYRSNATVNAGTETLQSVVEAICDRAGMDAAQYDATALASITKPVRSLAVAQVTSSRSVLEQLQTGYFFEASVSDKLRFLPRASASVETIPFADLGAGLNDASDQPLALTVASDLETPAMVALKYSNVENDHQAGTEYDGRALANQSSTSTIELALGFTPSEAKAIVKAVMADIKATLTTTEISLPLEYAHLEPADVVEVVDQDDTTYRMRLVRKTGEPGINKFEAVIDDAEVVSQAGVTDETDTPSSVVRGLADTVLLALDMPIARDADNSSGYYLAARGANSFWPGGVVQASVDDVSYATVATVNESAVLGACTTTLGDWAGGWVLDELNSVTVNMAHGTLSSTTRDTLLATPTLNAILIGSEVIRFVSAALQSAEPNIYKLTRLMRGQRGTEWACTGHAADERAVLIRPAGLRRVSTQTSEVGQLRYLKGITAGKLAADVTAQEFTNTDVGLKPFAPVDLRAVRNIGGDMTFTWRRRTRLGPRLFGIPGSGVPLGETSEAYEMEVWDATFTTLKRTYTGLTSPQATYTAAEQVADFGSIQATFYTRAFQVSAAVGRGYALQSPISDAYVAVPQVSTIALTGAFSAGVLISVRVGATVLAAYTTVLGDVDLEGVATSLAAAIDGTGGYSASATGPDVEVTGPDGVAFTLVVTVGGSSVIGFNLVQSAAAAGPGSPYTANLWVSNFITGATEPIPSGISFTLYVENPQGVVVGSVSYATTYSQTRFDVLNGLSQALVAHPVLPGLGYMLGLATSSSFGYYGVFTGPNNSPNLFLRTTVTAPFGLTVSLQSQGFAEVPTDRAQVVDATITGTPTAGDVFTIRLDGTPYSYSALPGDDEDDIAAGLVAVIDAAAGFGAAIPAAAKTARITSDTVAVSFYYDASVTRSIVAIVT